MKTPQFALATAVLMSLMTVTPTASGAATPKAPAPEVSTVAKYVGEASLSPTPDELIDIKRLAEESGMTVDQATMTTLGGQPFDRLVTLLQQKYPADFADAAFQAPETYVAFEGTAPDAALQDIKNAGVTIQVREGYLLNSADREQLVIDAAEAFVAQGNTGNVTGSIDPVTLDITLSYDGEPDLAISTASRNIEKVVIGEFTDYPTNASVTLTKVPGDGKAAEFQVMSGGAALGLGKDGGLNCTAGFNVRNVRGGVGLTSAGHCENFMNYERRNILIFQGEAGSVNTDVQWYTSNVETVWNQFIWGVVNGGPGLRAATSVGGTASGRQVCNFGEATGGSCNNYVQSTGNPVYQEETGTWYYGLSCVGGVVTALGDSGGPWFFANQARGMTTGAFFIDNARRSCFTPISRIESTTDLRVLVS